MVEKMPGSEVSSCSISSVTNTDNSQSMMSGIQELHDITDFDEEIEVESMMKRETTKAFICMHESSLDTGEIHDSEDESFFPDPLDISISIAEESDTDGREFLQAGQDVESEVHDLQETVDSCVLPEMKQKLQHVSEDDIKQDMFLVCKSSLENLAGTKKCNKCGKNAQSQFKRICACVILQWVHVCENKHEVGTWASTPTLKHGVFLGNMSLATAIALSGNNYQKVALLFCFMNIGMVNKDTFHSVTAQYVVPAVNDYWGNIILTTLEESRAMDMVVSGDGRMDSPGHCAHYCTYTMMNQSTKEIVAMEVIDKRECQLKSTLMEATGFRRALASITNEGVNVSECVTDVHPQISSIMKKEFGSITHSWDMWHGAKNLGKKLNNAAHEKGNTGLKPWVVSITNHFFHSAEKCEGDPMTLKVKMASVLNHCANRHMWALGQCDHEPLTDEERDKDWLDPKGESMKALEKIVLDQRFMRNMKYYVTCQTTSELESFNNHLLMYASKRQSYSYPVYKCRCQLAAIDYMKHLNRPYKLTKKGEPYFNRRFSKAANNWSVCPVKVEKEYIYTRTLMAKAVNLFCIGEKRISDRRVLEESDPRHIARTIAPKSPPSTKELAQGQKTRLEGKWKKPSSLDQINQDC